MKKICLLLSLLIATTAFAGIPKPQKNTYVNDFAGVLKADQIRSLNEKIHRIERLSSVQVAIVLVDKLPADYDIEDYALLIGRKWHVGKNKNGLVYVASISQRKQRFEVARLLNDKLTDEKCAAILSVIKPYFREKDYNGGLNAMVDELTTELVPAQPQSVAKASPRHVSSSAAPKKDVNPIIDFIATVITIFIVVGIPALIVYAIIRLFRRRSNTTIIQQPPVYNNNGGYNNGGYNSHYGGGYGNGYGNGYGGSGIGSNVGSFVAGAATGYAARTIQDHLSDDDNDRHRNNYVSEDRIVEDEPDSSDYDTSITSSDEDSSNWGDWGSGSSDNDSSSDNSSDSSSDSGYDGDRGATSDW